MGQHKKHKGNIKSDIFYLKGKGIFSNVADLTGDLCRRKTEP